MRFSRHLIPTYREDPAESEAISHKLMVRSGMVRQLAAGLYIFLPLGLRSMDKVNAIIRSEIDAIGGQEISMPVLQPADIWQQTGRWYDIGDEMFRLKDRTRRDMVLGMTHEEVVAWLAAREIRSYRDLPQIWYQIQTKVRDEARPKSGVLRTREFIMKDSYSLDVDASGLDHSYQLHYDAYCRIFDRCGVKYYAVESDPGMMGGAGAHEFMAPSEAGEDDVAVPQRCRPDLSIDSLQPFTMSPSRRGSSAFSRFVPRAAIAFSFFEPITAPKPPRPAMCPLSFSMQASLTLFSPAGPIAATRTAGSPSSSRIASSVSKASFPHSFPASRISIRSPWIHRYTGFSAAPWKMRAM
ncbi:MAG TPA: aminoacyl--tRNA ligase-related protein [Thermodesulfobacteriota bacterium]|nr:aminoacyl--tRNA ligase-related protein [Thermodesulfobacteriota bacterium]